MRVPSIGLPLDERLIIREGYRWAERALRGYEDPPTFSQKIARVVRQAMNDLYAILRG